MTGPAVSVAPTPPSAVRRVVVVEDHTAILEMMKEAIESVPGCRVVGTAGGLAAARELCRRLRPDLVVLDLALPEGSGLSLVPELRAECPRARVVIFSGHLRAASIKSALLSGAHGFVEKTASLDEFRRALGEVAAGRVYFSRFASDEIRRIVHRGPSPRARMVRLTEREKAVLGGIADGRSSKQIAERLGISRHTVVNHRRRLMSKIGVRGVAHLARYAVQIGLVEARVEDAAEPY